MSSLQARPGWAGHSQGDFLELFAASHDGSCTCQHVIRHGDSFVVVYTVHPDFGGKTEHRVGIARETAEGCLYRHLDYYA